MNVSLCRRQLPAVVNALLLSTAAAAAGPVNSNAAGLAR